MTRQIACPQCGKTYTISERLAGKEVRCKNCDGQFIIAETEAPPEEPPATMPDLVDPLFTTSSGAIGYDPLAGAYPTGPTGQPHWASNRPQPSSQSGLGPFDFVRHHLWAAAGLGTLIVFVLTGFVMICLSAIVTVFLGLPLALLALLGLITAVGAIIVPFVRGATRDADFGDLLWLLISPAQFGYRMGQKGNRFTDIRFPTSLLRASMFPLIALVGFAGGAYCGAALGLAGNLEAAVARRPAPPLRPPGVGPGAGPGPGVQGGAPAGNAVTDDTPLKPGDRLQVQFAGRLVDGEVVEVLPGGNVRVKLSGERVPPSPVVMPRRLLRLP